MKLNSKSDMIIDRHIGYNSLVTDFKIFIYGDI